MNNTALRDAQLEGLLAEGEGPRLAYARERA
jgi:hypothetical protein